MMQQVGYTLAVLLLMFLGAAGAWTCSQANPNAYRERNRDYLKEHLCIRAKDTPAVGTKNDVRELYLCEKDGPRGRRVWVSQ